MKSVVSVNRFIRKYYAEVEIAEIIQDTNTVSVIYNSDGGTYMELWDISTEPKGKGRATIDLEVVCSKCKKTNDSVCTCELTGHWSEEAGEDMYPMIMTEARGYFKLERRQSPSEFAKDFMNGMSLDKEEDNPCTCEYEEEQDTEFYNNHGSCQHCYFVQSTH